MKSDVAGVKKISRTRAPEIDEMRKAVKKLEKLKGETHDPERSRIISNAIRDANKTLTRAQEHKVGRTSQEIETLERELDRLRKIFDSSKFENSKEK